LSPLSSIKQAVPKTALETLEESALAVHMRTMEALDDVVTAFMKIKDVEGIHEAARLTWNAGLVLLQPDRRRHVKRAFNSAAKALEVGDGGGGCSVPVVPAGTAVPYQSGCPLQNREISLRCQPTRACQSVLASTTRAVEDITACALAFSADLFNQSQQAPTP
jgi:hypothetical protein